MHRYPVDSAEARELREQDAENHTPTGHDPRGRDGWLGDDAHDRLIPCRECRPHLAPWHRRPLSPA